MTSAHPDVTDRTLLDPPGCERLTDAQDGVREVVLPRA